MNGSDLERLRRDTNQRTSMVKTLDGETGLGCFVPGQDDFNEDECKKSSDQWTHDLEMSLLWPSWIFDSSAELKSVAADFYHALILF